MSSLISNKELTLKLEQFIPSASEVNIISAFITMSAYSWLCELTKVNLPIITLVGRFLPKDFIDGASSIEAIRLSLLSGYSVSILSNLHAKIFQIDSDLIFTGSANMTGKGLALVEQSNLEACTEVAPTDESKAFIKRIIDSSITLTLEHLQKMQKFIDDVVQTDSPKIPENWPEELINRSEALFVSDFPLTKPGSSCEIYKINTSIDFAVIEVNRADFNYAQLLFKSSKAYSWLKTLLIKHLEKRDPGFGQISSMLHNVLCDDPAPYRKDIKDIQANFYEYIALYASDEIQIYVPGKRSQILRILK